MGILKTKSSEFSFYFHLFYLLQNGSTYTSMSTTCFENASLYAFNLASDRKEDKQY